MIGRYRKLPVEVEALEFRLGTTSKEDILQFCPTANVGTPWEGDQRDIRWLCIPTLEGEMFTSDGDYIIKGVNGEFYPCKPDIFAKTYEPV